MTTYRVLSDLLYRSVATVDPSNSITEAYDTDAYGNTLCYSGPGTDGDWFTDDDVQTNSPVNCTIFTGRQYDPESQIYYYRARYYSPAIGRFISRDPLGSPLMMEGATGPSGSAESSLEASLYWYAQNDPTNKTDSSGLASSPGPNQLPSPTKPCCNGIPYDPTTQCCKFGKIVSAWVDNVHPTSGSGFAGQPNSIIPPTVHQLQKFANLLLTPIGNPGGVSGDLTGANNTAAKVLWSFPCGGAPILDMQVERVPEPGSGNPIFEGVFATLEIKSRYAVLHTVQQACAATTAKFRCCNDAGQ